MRVIGKAGLMVGCTLFIAQLNAFGQMGEIPIKLWVLDGLGNLSTLTEEATAEQTGITNGGFEVGFGDGWPFTGDVDFTSGLWGTWGFITPQGGRQFAFFNGYILHNGPLTQNIISQDFVADGDMLVFHWNRKQRNYPENAGVTFQVRYQDLTQVGPIRIVDIDHAPQGTTPAEELPWTQEQIPGFTPGHRYRLWFLGGFAEDIGPNPGELIYALDSVGMTNQ